MFKSLKFFLLPVIIITIIFAYYSLPIINGYGAKVMCTAVFMAHRDPQNIIKEDLNFLPFTLVTVKVNYKDSSVTGSIFGMAQKKAIYRNGLGSTVINEISEPELRKQIKFVPQRIDNNAKLSWPDGDVLKDTIYPEINYKQLDSSIEYPFKQQPDQLKKTRAIIIVYKGNIVREKYASGYSKESVLSGWSMAKSITNALLGILVKNKKIELSNTSLFTEWANDDRKNITIADLMQMSSGLNWSEFYAGPSDVTNMLYKEYDMGNYALNKKPGPKKFYYSSGNANILSLKIRQVLGDNDYYSFPQMQLFNKIGMRHAILEPDASGTFVGSSYCYATPRDWARFGLLYLHNGVWNNERILPEGWVKFSTSTIDTRTDKRWGKFGALWWVNKGDINNPIHRRYPDVPEDCFSAMGFEGQSLWIIPSKDLVIIRMSCEHDHLLDGNKFLSSVISSFKR